MDFFLNFYMNGKDLCLKHIENGVLRYSKIQLKPSLFYVDPDNSSSQFHTLDGRPLSEMQYDNVFEALKSIKTAKSSGNNDCLLFGFPKFEYTYIDEKYPGQDGIEFDPSMVKIMNIDIETECESRDYPISHKIKVRKKT